MTSGIRRGLTHYGDPEFSLFLRKAFIKAMGYSDDALTRPIVGITNTYSDFNPCHATVPQLIAAVKRGVMLAGALPLEFPTISIHESFAYPTSMYLRNLMALDTEEMIRAQPVDAVVLIGGCDKTIPAQLMGAASANVPTIVVPTGPMLTRTHDWENGLGRAPIAADIGRDFAPAKLAKAKSTRSTSAWCRRPAPAW
jgi:dihydroxy-acid dehydratase